MNEFDKSFSPYMAIYTDAGQQRFGLLPLPDEKKIKSKRKKRIIRLITTLLVLALIGTLVGIYWLPIVSKIGSWFYAPPVATGGNAFSLFTGIDKYPDSVEPYYEGQAFGSLFGIEGMPTMYRTSQDVGAALEMYRIAHQNLWLANSWGSFMDIKAAETEVHLGSTTGIGTFATQVQKVQDGDSFFLNEGFALVDFAFIDAGDTEFLSRLLMTFISGGCRILTDAQTNKKYIQWAKSPMETGGGSLYFPETGMIETSLKEIGVHPVDIESKDYKPYEKDKEFEILLPLDFTSASVSSVEIIYYPMQRYYVLDCQMNGAALTASGQMAGVIQKLFGTDVKLTNTTFYDSSRFLITIWDNGFIRSAECDLEWSADVAVSVFNMSVISRKTSIDFFFSYADEDCLVSSIRSRYYNDFDFTTDTYKTPAGE